MTLTEDYAQLDLRVRTLEGRMTTVLQLQADYAALDTRVSVLEGASPQRQLVGGWRIAGPFSLGTIAIDFDTQTLWMGGHGQRHEVVRYQLPAAGTGSNVDDWPRVDPSEVIADFWGDGYCNGLCFWQGKLWASGRVFYDMQPPLTTRVVAIDGEVIDVPIGRQAYSGFVKRGPGLEPYLGCGGYESGQGWTSGPTLAKLDGTVLIPAWNSGSFATRCPREPNYYPWDGVDSWVCYAPQDGKGAWASDRLYGGGLELPEGFCYWPLMGVDDLNYSRQTATFGDPAKDTVYQYTFGKDYQLVGWRNMKSELPTGIRGQELDADGNVYLSEQDAWSSERYKVDPVIKIFS